MSTAPAPASSTDQPAASPASAKEDHYFLPLNEASHTVDVKSGDVLTEALTKSPENPNAEHFLVAVHPDGQPKQSEVRRHRCACMPAFRPAVAARCLG